MNKIRKTIEKLACGMAISGMITVPLSAIWNLFENLNNMKLENTVAISPYYTLIDNMKTDFITGDKYLARQVPQEHYIRDYKYLIDTRGRRITDGNMFESLKSGHRRQEYSFLAILLGFGMSVIGGGIGVMCENRDLQEKCKK